MANEKTSLSFSHRMRIAKKFVTWAMQNGVKISPVNVIAFLQMNGLVHISDAIKFANEQ